MATISVKLSNILFTEKGTGSFIFETTNPRAHFVQNQSCTAAGIAIQNYGVAMIPDAKNISASYILEAELNGVHYYATKAAVEAVNVGGTLTMSDVEPT